MRPSQPIAWTLLFLFFTAGTLSAAEEGGVHTGKLFTLDEVLSRALTDHPSVAKALIGVKRAQELKEAADAKAYPALSVEAYGAMATGEKRGLLYSDVSLRLPFFAGGKFKEERKLRSVDVELKELSSEEVKLYLALEVRKIYYELLSHKELTRLTQEVLKELREYAVITRSLYEKEAVTKLVLLRAETLLARGQHLLVGHKQESDYLLFSLSQILQLTDHEHIELSPVTHFSEVPVFSPDELGSMVEESIALKTQQNNIVRKTHELKMLKGERWPELSLSTRYNRHNDVFVDTNRFMVGIEGRFALWDFGRLNHEIKAKAYELEETRFQAKIEEENKIKRIRRLLADFNTLKEGIKQTEADILERREVYKNDKAELAAGEKGRSETLESFLKLHEAERDRLKAITDYRIRLAEYLYEAEVKL